MKKGMKKGLKKYLLIILCACVGWMQAQEVTVLPDSAIPELLPIANNAPDGTNAAAEKEDPFAFFQPFYKHSGVSYVSLMSVGYSTVFLLPNNPRHLGIAEFTGRQHFLNVSFIDFRVHFVGAELLDFEFGVNTPGRTKNGVNLAVTSCGVLDNPDSIAPGSLKTMWFAWKPCIKFYIPATKWLAAEVYAGAEVDITQLWNQVMPKYYGTKFNPANNHFVGGFGGIGLLFAGKVAVPIELKCEYRCPSKGSRALVPEGFYLAAQLHIGWMLNERGKVLNK